MQDFSNDEFLKNSSGKTLLVVQGDSAKIDGTFKISQSIEVDCEVTGEMDIDGQLIISENGFVSADVKTTDAIIVGKYEGNMEASGTVEIKETGQVNGNIKTDSLIINKGGKFDGNVSRISSPR